MRKYNVGLLALFGVVAFMAAGSRAAVAMAGKHGKGDPKHPISASFWPKGVEVVANRTDRFGGYWINASDVFYYAGDAKDFNEFLQQYAKVQVASLTLTIDGSSSSLLAGGFGQEGGQADWQLSVTGWSKSRVGLVLPLGRQIALKDLKVPVNVDINYVGEKTPEVTTFLAAHKALQDKAKAGSPGK